MALEKRNVEAALESKKERISELETALADLKKERELVSTSLPSENIPRTDEMTQENSSTANVAVYATEIENLQKRISGMVIFFFIIALFKLNFNLMYTLFSVGP